MKMNIYIGAESVFGIFFCKWVISDGADCTVKHSGTLRETYKKFCNKRNIVFSEDTWKMVLEYAIKNNLNESGDLF